MGADANMDMRRSDAVVEHLAVAKEESMPNLQRLSLNENLAGGQHARAQPSTVGIEK